MASPAPRPGFTPGRVSPPHWTRCPARPELALRPARDDDVAWLGALYDSTRQEEMDAAGLPPALRAQFLDSQFELQHLHYLTHYADADFLIVEHDGHAIGRYYLLRAHGPGDDLIVDISVMPQWRGRGIGAALIAASQADAMARGRGMTLHVRFDNTGAQRLYARLGFRPRIEDGPWWRMDWRPGAGGANA